MHENEIPANLSNLRNIDKKAFEGFNKANKPDVKDFTFVFPEKLIFKSFDSVTTQLSHFLRKIGHPFTIHVDIEEYYKAIFSEEYPGKVIFDLSKTSYIGELEILMIHILGQFCQKITRKQVIVRFNQDKIGFLARWNFFEDFWEWGQIENSKIFEETFFYSTTDSDVLLPITKIADYPDVGTTINRLTVTKIKNMLIRAYGMDKKLIDAFTTEVISEICQNIPQHSKSTGYILVHARGLKPDEDEKIPNLEIAISDWGIGIKQSLYNRFPDIYRRKKHFEIIEEVLEGKFPTLTDENHGGILRARQFVDGFGGIIFIRSICGKAGNKHFTPDYDKNWRFFPGTHVNILIPALAVKNRNRRAP